MTFMTKEVRWYKNVWLWGFLIVLLLVLFFSRPNSSPGEYDTFASCLSEAGAVMYGTEWCPHCKEQKKLFGNSFKNINYVDCDIDSEECLINRVDGYPTWKVNGKNYPGVQPLTKLSLLTGCDLVKDE